MKTKIFASATIIYIIIVAPFIRDKIFSQNVGLFTILHFLILAVLAILFFKNYKPANKKHFAISVSMYAIATVIIAVWFGLNG